MNYITSVLAVFSVYWKDPRIHTLGNFGYLGALHASIAPAFTHGIDKFVYNNRNVREELHNSISTDNNIVDFGCGTGLSTPRRRCCIGVDVSNEMLNIARLINPIATFVQGNVESWGQTKMVDVVTICFLFHEVPPKGRNRIIKNSLRLARKKVFVLDIAPEYVPSAIMLQGEPFITEYLMNIDSEMENHNFKRTDLIKGHVRLWSYSL